MKRHRPFHNIPGSSVTCLLFAALGLMVWPGCQTSDRTGEISLYKAAPINASTQPERGSTMHVLRERGFAVSDNQFRLANVLGDFNCVGLLTVRESLSQTSEDSLRAKLACESRGEAQSPKGRQIEKICTDTDTLLKLPILEDKVLLDKEARLSQFLALLADTRNFLEDLDYDLQDARDALQREGVVDNFDVLFRIMGHPLLPDEDWKRERAHTLKTNLPVCAQWKVLEDNKGVELEPVHPEGAFTRLQMECFTNHFNTLHTNWSQAVGSSQDWQTLGVAAKIEDLRPALAFILEDSLNLV